MTRGQDDKVDTESGRSRPGWGHRAHLRSPVTLPSARSAMPRAQLCLPRLAQGYFHAWLPTTWQRAARRVHSQGTVIALPASGVSADQTSLLPALVTAVGLWVHASVSHRANSRGRSPGPSTVNSALLPGAHTSIISFSSHIFLLPTSICNQIL